MSWLSMTGYGQGHCATPNGGHWRAELRAVNSKNLELRTTLPPHWGGLDILLNRWIRQHIYRGRIDLRLDFTPPPSTLSFDLSRAQQTFQQLETISASLGLPPPSLSDLLRLSHLWSANTPVTSLPDEQTIDLSWQHLQPALGAALDRFQTSRAQEGAALSSLIHQHLSSLLQHLSSARALAPLRVDSYRLRLQERLDALDPPLKPSPRPLPTRR